MIDFTTLFAKSTIEPLHFVTRRDINYEHEIIFLSSYLHDARFKKSDFKEHEGIISIHLERDCWEFFTRIHEASDGLLCVPSILTISGVDQVIWSGESDNSEISIRSVFIGERQHLEQETAHLVFDCPFQNLRIDLVGSRSFFDIRLEDQDTPR